MLAPISKLKESGNSVSLIPRSGVQFIDLGFSVDRFARLTRSFWEKPRTGSGEPNTTEWDLRALEQNDEGTLVDVETREKPPRDTDYDVKASEAVELFLEKWIPLPYFRVIHEERGIPVRFAKGPSNWARARVCALPTPDHDGNTHRITVAFDTELLPEDESRPYLAPSPEDARSRKMFALAPQEAHNGWLLQATWVDGWLQELREEHVLAKLRQRNPTRRVELPPREYPFCKHWATYLTLLRLFDEADVFPRIWMVDARDARPIDVDLALDLGNARTCGVLIETNIGDTPNLNQCYILELRDLTRPQFVYREPFESRVEFALPEFGKERHSRRGGRARAFLWPTVARIGPEAAALSLATRGTEGYTGMSSPKRYLWDERAREQEWIFNNRSGVAGEAEPVTKGAFVQLIDDEGRPLDADSLPAIRASYSRSSLMTFALSEILLHAVTLINSVARRYERQHKDVPRRLRSIVMTMPTAMPLPERRIFEQRARQAVELLWKVLGWSDESGYSPKPPEVRLRWDEATCTQLVFLYAEVREKFQGSPNEMFRRLGRRRGGSTAPSIRIASLDIGGGTTDLIITTYTDQSSPGNPAAALTPDQNFREGFNVAGDDIVKGVVERVLLPALVEAMGAAGVRDPGSLATRLFGADYAGQTGIQQAERRKFALQVLAPVAIRLLQEYETTTPKRFPEPTAKPLQELLSDDKMPGSDVVSYVEDAVVRAGGRDFALLTVPVPVDFGAVDRAVRRVIEQVLSDLSEIVHAYDCDVLLLSGRPSRLPAVLSIVRSRIPVRPGLIHPMYGYRVGTWYPFRDSADRIDDPKTTAAMGAMLCALAEGSLEGFWLDSAKLTLKSTARYIGAMETSGRIPTSNVFFSNVDLDVQQAVDQHICSMVGPLSIGARQMPVERWPTTPLYKLEFRDPSEVRGRYKLPLRVPVGRGESRREEDDERMKESFVVLEGVEDAEGTAVRRGAVVLRLQTLADAQGYWLDTGVFSIA